MWCEEAPLGLGDLEASHPMRRVSARVECVKVDPDVKLTRSFHVRPFPNIEGAGARSNNPFKNLSYFRPGLTAVWSRRSGVHQSGVSRAFSRVRKTYQIRRPHLT